ncbi:toll/interleukin-1 receptor domain-containing protein [Allorhizocola rhizosphaerae]|uniref:toll/interleukin-1 receptor domain-containing protein n=1 Tax=Allorhizocola rhizosphaerae TaxID=1872709 RepID=UPI003CCC635D
MQPGENYAEQIGVALKSCHTVLVLISPEWVKRLKLAGTDEPDWVHTEIALALAVPARVIPILLSHAPAASRLPAQRHRAVGLQAVSTIRASQRRPGHGSDR